VAGPLGEIGLQENVYAPVLDALAGYQPRSLAEIEAAVAPAGVSTSQLIQAVVILTACGYVQAVQDDVAIAGARPQSERLNRHLCQMAVTGTDVHYLASPVTGGGVPVDRFSQLFLLSHQQGKSEPGEWVADANALLLGQNQRLQKEGAPMTPEAQVAELRRMADQFAEYALPILKGLGIAS
jgi:hypothetical protein